MTVSGERAPAISVCVPIGQAQGDIVDSTQRTRSVAVQSPAAALQSSNVTTKSPQGLHDVLVIIPTYNETENAVRMVHTILRTSVRVEVLIVDDHSPDGTGQLVDQLAAHEPRVHVLHRRGPRGLGAAYMAGFRWALRREYQYVIQMDADFSHDPAAIPKLLDYADRYDVVIGSRYCGGGRTVGWPKSRQWLSFTANIYARTLLSSRIRDLTSGFRCWRRDVLEHIDFARLRSNGYEFQVEMGYLARLAGARIHEVPITFRERSDGSSKMSPEVARQAFWQIARLAGDRVLGIRHPALLSGAGNCQPKTSTSVAVAPKNVLVMCLGGIGDTVLSVAMLRQLRQRLPNAKLTALTMWSQSAELLEDLGILDEIQQHNFQQDRGWRSIKKLIELHFRRYDLSILAFPANRWEFNLTAWLIHARQRVGHQYTVGDDIKLDFLLTDKIRQNVRTHNIDENLKLLSQVPGHKRVSVSAVDIRLGPLAREYHAYAERLLAAIPGPYLGIHAGTNTFKNMAARRWPPEYFAQLCRLVNEHLGMTPLLFGAGEEILLNNYIAGQCATSGASIAQVVVTPAMRHTAAVMQRCAVFVSNDSSLAHIASALDVPTVMIVGPTDPAGIGPYTERGMAITADLPCAPCYRPYRQSLSCSEQQPYGCLRRISPEAVLQCVRRLVLTGQNGASVAEKMVCFTDSAAALTAGLTCAETDYWHKRSAEMSGRDTEMICGPKRGMVQRCDQAMER